MKKKLFLKFPKCFFGIFLKKNKVVKKIKKRSKRKRERKESLFERFINFLSLRVLNFPLLYLNFIDCS